MRVILHFILLLLLPCLFTNCTRNLPTPWLNGKADASDRMNIILPSLALAFDNTALSFSPWQSGFTVHNILDSSTRYYAISGESNYTLEIRFHVDSVALYSGKSITVLPTRFTIYQYGTSPIAVGPSNISLTITYSDYKLQGFYSGWFYNQLTGAKSSVSGTVADMPLTISD